jgi:hypothetical protein
MRGAGSARHASARCPSKTWGSIPIGRSGKRTTRGHRVENTACRRGRKEPRPRRRRAREEVPGVLGPTARARRRCCEPGGRPGVRSDGCGWKERTRRICPRGAECRGLGYVPQVPSVLRLDRGRQHPNLRAGAGRPGRSRGTERFGPKKQVGGSRARPSGGERRRPASRQGRGRKFCCATSHSRPGPCARRLVGVWAGRLRWTVIADHRMSDALAICDRAMLLVDGSTEALGPASSFEDHPSVQSRYTG